jgi:large subunit ribosomal protein LP2
MKHLAAYLLLSLNGGSPSQSDVKKLLSSVGIEADEERLEKLFSELAGKDINEVFISLVKLIKVDSNWCR